MRLALARALFMQLVAFNNWFILNIACYYWPVSQARSAFTRRTDEHVGHEGHLLVGESFAGWQFGFAVEPAALGFDGFLYGFSLYGVGCWNVCHCPALQLCTI